MEIKSEEIEKIIKNEGKINGMGILEDKKYILNKFGQNVLLRIEREISALANKEFSYNMIKTYDYYPICFSALATLILKYDFKFSEEEIKEFGKEGAKLSFLVRVFLSHIVSLKKITKEAKKIWRRYFINAGNLEVEKLDEANHTIIIRITGFDIHPLYCKQIEGVISQIFSYVVNKKYIQVKEVECTFKGGQSHKFAITW